MQVATLVTFSIAVVSCIIQMLESSQPNYNPKEIEDCLKASQLIKNIEAAQGHHLFYYPITQIRQDYESTEFYSDSLKNLHMVMQLRQYDTADEIDKKELGKIVLNTDNNGGMPLWNAQHIIKHLDNLDSADVPATYLDLNVGVPKEFLKHSSLFGKHSVIVMTMIYEPPEYTYSLYVPSGRQPGKFVRQIIIEDSDDKMYFKTTLGQESKDRGMRASLHSINYGNFLLQKNSSGYWFLFKRCDSPIENVNKEVEIVKALVRKVIAVNNEEIRVRGADFSNNEACSKERFINLLAPKPRPAVIKKPLTFPIGKILTPTKIALLLGIIVGFAMRSRG